MESTEKKDLNIQWQPLIEMIVVLMTILGSTIPLYLNTDSKIDAIREEMKQFHGRMEKQDAEFKAFLMYGNKEKAQ